MLTLFRIENGEVVCSRAVPAFYYQLFCKALFAVRGPRSMLWTQSEIDRLIRIAVSAPKASGSESSGTQLVMRMESEEIFEGEHEDFVRFASQFDHDLGRYRWAEDVDDTEHRLIAAFALLNIDRSAAAYVDGDMSCALRLLGIVGLLAADFGFHGGYQDRDSLVREAGTSSAQKRWAGLPDIKKEAIRRWKEGSWRSMRNCAEQITNDIIVIAKEHGIHLLESNATRTIYDWLRSHAKSTDG